MSRNFAIAIAVAVVSGAVFVCADHAQTSPFPHSSIANPTQSLRPETFVAPGDDGDWALAIERAQLYCYNQFGGGCTIELTCGYTYTIKTTIDGCTPMRLTGCAVNDTGSEIATNAAGVTGIHLRYREQCPDATIYAHGKWEIDHIRLTGVVNGVDYSAGIRADVPFHAHDMYIEKFTQGIRIVDSVDYTPPSNCNLWRMENVRIEMCEHAGMFLQGGDSNAGLANAVNTSQNCRNAAVWNEALKPSVCVSTPSDPTCAATYACAGVLDHSFLGNTYTAMHAATNRDITPNPDVYYPAFVFANTTSRSVCVGCYSESGQPPSWVSVYSNVLGGIAPWVGDGSIIRGGNFNRIAVVNDSDANNSVTVKMGNSEGSGVIMHVDPASSSVYPLRLKLTTSTKLYSADLANLSAYGLFRVVGYTGAALGSVASVDLRPAQDANKLMMPDEVIVNGLSWTHTSTCPGDCH